MTPLDLTFSKIDFQCCECFSDILISVYIIFGNIPKSDIVKECKKKKEGFSYNLIILGVH